MPKQAAKLLFLSPFPLGEGPGMGPYVMIGAFTYILLNGYLIFANSPRPSYFTKKAHQMVGF